VEKAEDYPCSSAKAHIHGVKDKILGEALFEGGQMEDYIELMKASIEEEEINNIRNHARNGRPIGSENFIEKIERKLDRIFKSKPRGRPKKEKR
jgi:putative transposase